MRISYQRWILQKFLAKSSQQLHNKLIIGDFKSNSDGIVATIKTGYGVLNVITIDVLCALDSENHAIGYDNGSNVRGIAKYTGEFEEGTECYIELMVKDSELYMSIHGKGEAVEYDKLVTDAMMDLHK